MLACIGIGVLCLFLGSASTSFAISRTLEEANRHKILLISVGSEPQTLDPQLSQRDTEHQIIAALMAGLVENDEYNQANLGPRLAAHWDHNDDSSASTLHI